MDLASALAAIQNCNELPNRAEIYSAINAEVQRVSGLEEEKKKLAENNADLLTQNKNKGRELANVTKLLEDLTKAAGAEGETVEEQLNKLKELAKQKNELEAKLKTEEEDKTAALSQILELKKNVVLQNIHRITKADYDALGKLFNVELDKVAIDGDKVTIAKEDGSKVEFMDYVKGEGAWMERAFFPTEATTTPKPEDKRLPSAPPTSSPKAEVSAKTVVRKLGFTGPPSRGEAS